MLAPLPSAKPMSSDEEARDPTLKEDRQAFLLNLSDVLRGIENPVAIQEEACRLLGIHLDVCRVVYAEPDMEGSAVPMAQYVNGVEHVSAGLGVAAFDERLAEACRRGRPVVQADVSSDPHLTAEQKEAYARWQIGAYVVVPLVQGEGVISRLAVHHLHAHAWSDAEVELVAETAERLWTALERALSAAALRRSEERFRALVTASSYVVYRMNVDWTATLDADRQGPTQPWGMDAIHPEDRPAVAAAIQRAIVSKSTFELEHRVQQVDGSTGWTLLRAVPLLDDKGEVTEWFGAASDVTGRKRDEEVLRENEERQAFLLTLSDSVRAMGDPNQIKETATRMLGQHLAMSSMGYAEVEADGDTMWAGGEYQDASTPHIKGWFRLSDFGAGFGIALRAGREVYSTDIATDPRGGGSASLVSGMPDLHAVAALPLIKNGTLVACLYAAHFQPRDWPETDRQLMREVAERTWAAVERARAEQALAADLRDTQLLREMGARFVLEKGEMQSLCDELNEAARKLTHAEGGTVQIYDPEAGQLLLQSVFGFPADARERFGRVDAGAATACACALVAGIRTFVDFDDATLEDPKGNLRWHVDAGYLSGQSTPLIARSGRVIGMVSTHWQRRRRPSERELRFLDLLARQAADLIEQWQSQCGLRESEERLAAELSDTRHLQQISSQLLLEDNSQALYGQIVDAAIGLLKSDAGCIRMREPETNDLLLLAWRGFNPASVRFWQRVGQGHPSSWGLALSTEARVIVPDVEKWAPLADSAELGHYRLSGLKAVQSTPLISRNGHVVGVLSTCWQSAHEASERELRLLDVLARQAADLIERQISADALRSSEERYRTLFESIDEGFCLIEMLFDENDMPIDYRFIEANPAFEKHTGLHDPLGRTMREMAPDHDQHWFEIYGRIALTGFPERFELPAEALGRFYDVYAFRVGTPEQRRVGILFDDITGRKLTEDLLRQEADLDAFRVALNDALHSLTDPAEVQAAATRVLGVHLQATRALYAEVASDKDAHHYAVLQDYGVPGEPSLIGDYKVTEQDKAFFEELRAGRTVMVSDTAQGARSHGASPTWSLSDMHAFMAVPSLKDGRRMAFIAVCQTEARKWTEAEIAVVEEAAERAGAAVESARFEQALRHGEERQAFLLALSDAIRPLSTPDDIMEMAVGMLGRQLQATQAGYAETDNGESYIDVRVDWTEEGGKSGVGLHPMTCQTEADIRSYQAGQPWVVEDAETDPRPTVRNAAAACIEAGARAMVNVPLIKDGRWAAMLYATSGVARRWSNAEIELVREVAERTWTALELARAQAALREAKEAAETANQSKDHFLAVLSHELRTPLTPVLMTVDSLQQDASLSPAVREDLAMMKRNIQLETKLIDDLLDISRITSGKLALHVSSVDLNDVVRNVCRICGPLIRERGIELKIRLDRAGGVINADPARLQQVLWNVLMNAIKFTPAGGSITVGTSWLSGERCEVRISDNGAGITPDVLPHIFNAFEQGGANITRQFGGLGLGLAICKALVELHHGSIRAESPGPGLGAAFIIELPGRAMTATAKIRLAAPSKPEQSGHLRLLVVEDHADTMRTLAALLRRAGFTVVTAPSVTAAIETAKGGAFDLLVSDLGLPDGTGYDVMRNVHALLGIPGVAMSGFGMEEDIRRSREAGFSEHLVKPIDIAELIATIRRVAAKRLNPP